MKIKIAISVGLILLIETLYYITFSHNKFFVIFNSNFIGDFIYNVLYFLVYFIIYFYILMLINNVKIKNISATNVIIYLSFLFIIRLVWDSLKYICSVYFTQYSSPIDNVIEVFFIASMYLIILQLFLGVPIFKLMTIPKNKKIILLTFLSIVLAISIYIAWYSYELTYFNENFDINMFTIITYDGLIHEEAQKGIFYSSILNIYVSILMFICTALCINNKKRIENT